MQLRTWLLSLLLAPIVACGGGGPGKLNVDTPALPYEAPDISEITGIDEEEEEEEETAEEPAPAPEAAKPAPVPAATPAKAAVKTPAAKTPVGKGTTPAPAAAAPKKAAAPAATPEPKK